MKCGTDGAFAVERDGTVTRVPALPVEAVDTTGAGDSFDAGFLAGFLAGRPVGTCLALGVAAGALSTRGIGGTAGAADARRGGGGRPGLRPDPVSRVR